MLLLFLIIVRFDFNAGTFSVMAKKVNLTGLNHPIRFEMATERYFAVGEAEILNDKPLPMPFLLGHEDLIRVDHFHMLGNNRSGTFRNKVLVVRGAIATTTYPIDLEGREITVSWGGTSTTIPDGFNGLKQRGNRNLFTYNSGFNSLSRAVFDLDRATFKVVINDSTLFLNSAPRSFAIEFEISDPGMPTTTFSETVTSVGIGVVPADSSN